MTYLEIIQKMILMIWTPVSIFLLFICFRDFFDNSEAYEEEELPEEHVRQFYDQEKDPD